MNQVIAYTVLLLLLAATGGGFYLGYESGRNPAETQALREQVEEQSERLERLEGSLRQLELRQASSTYATSSSPAAPAPAAPSSQPLAPHAFRAEQKTQVFTDSQGRELLATIIEVGADTSRVKRESDGRYFDLRHADLIAEDRAFLQYLYAEKHKSEPGSRTSSSAKSSGEPDWAAIFGN